MSKPITLEELAAMYMAGGRNSKERSRAVESRYYGRNGDPLNHVKFERERKTKKGRK